jgi:RecB family endonuclease NucS
MLVIAARMWARYSGRVEAELSPGDALLLIRNGPHGDGSVVVLSNASGVLPRNWMPAGSQAEELDTGWVFSKGSERLEVYIDQLYFRQEVADQLDPHLQKTGTEAQLSDYLAEHLDLLQSATGGRHLQLIAREQPTAAGPIDILAQDQDDIYWLIEVKRRKCTIADTYQLRRYYHYFSAEQPEAHCQGLLVGPGATRSLREMLRAGQSDQRFPLHFFLWDAGSKADQQK